MKKIIFLLFLSTTIYTTLLNAENGIEFIIKDYTIKDSSFINLLIKNKSTINYYLPLLNTIETEKWLFIIKNEDSKFFFLDRNYYDSKGNTLNWRSRNSKMKIDKLEKLTENWRKKKKSIQSKDLIMINSGDSLIIKVSINLFVKITDSLTVFPRNFDKKDSLFVRLIYNSKSLDMEKNCLSKKTINKLKQLGYKLYTKKIISNSVNFIPNTLNYNQDIIEIKKDIDSGTIKFHY